MKEILEGIFGIFLALLVSCLIIYVAYAEVKPYVDAKRYADAKKLIEEKEGKLKSVTIYNSKKVIIKY